MSEETDIRATIEIHLGKKAAEKKAIAALGSGWKRAAVSAGCLRFISRQKHRDFIAALWTAASGEQKLRAAFPGMYVVVGACAKEGVIR